MTIQESIVRTKLEICSKVMRSGYHPDLIPPLDIRLDTEDLHEDIMRLRQLQDLEYDVLKYNLKI